MNTTTATAATTMLAIAAASIELAAGEIYAGLVLDDDGKPSHHLVLLPGDAKNVTWQAAIDWAATVGGELPTRREQSLLFANAKQHIEPAWYWSAESHSNASYAWGQSFSNGDQYGYRKSYEERARAVRRIHVGA